MSKFHLETAQKTDNIISTNVHDCADIRLPIRQSEKKRIIVFGQRLTLPHNSRRNMQCESFVEWG